MKFLCVLSILVPAACLTAQTPAPPPTPAQAPAATAIPAEQVPPDKVVITIGDRKITVAEFNQMIEGLPEQYRVAARGPSRRQFAESLVQMLVLSQEAKREKLDESPEYKAMIRYQSENILAGLAYADMGKKATPGEADLRKYYDEHKSEFEQVRARHILIRMQGSQVPVRQGQKELTDAEALAKAQALRKRVLAGEDFAKLAEQESDDVGTGANGGDLGTFGHNQMVKPFEDAVFAMKPGDLSEPVKTQFGYHIIKLESKSVRSYEDAKADLARQLGPTQAQKALKELVDKSSVSLDPSYFPAPQTR